MLLVRKQRQRAVLSKNTVSKQGSQGRGLFLEPLLITHTQYKTQSTSCCRLCVFSFRRPIAEAFSTGPQLSMSSWLYIRGQSLGFRPGDGEGLRGSSLLHLKVIVAGEQSGRFCSFVLKTKSITEM